MKIRNIILLILGLTLITCSQKLTKERKILFVGHTYYWHHYLEVDIRIRLLDFDNFDELWLGGDLTTESSINKKQIEKLNNFYKLSDTVTHWALGNHDARKGNINIVEQIQQKPTYYVQHDNGLTKLILNTTIANEQVPIYKDSCHLLKPQTELINSVLDTISKSSHLIIMTGGAHWGEIVSATQLNYNYPHYSFSCDKNFTFKKFLYPKLVEVQKRGVQVICTSGDLGMRSKSYHKKSDDGIIFLASGINNSFGTLRNEKYKWVRDFSPDKILIFTHYPEKRELTFEFVDLNNYIGVKPF